MSEETLSKAETGDTVVAMEADEEGTKYVIWYIVNGDPDNFLYVELGETRVRQIAATWLNCKCTKGLVEQIKDQQVKRRAVN